MKVEIFEGKNKEALIEKALKEMGVTEKDILYNFEESKSGLFKGTTYKLKVIKNEEIASYLRDYLQELTKNMGIDVSFETKIRGEQISIKMYSDNNSILIGKNGKTLSALQTILRQKVYNQIEKYPYIILDVENYKEKQQQHLERLAKRLAKEVQKTKIDTTMENMNSYERRIVHNALANFKNISTVSEGEEPNRHVIIKYNE